VLDVSEAADHGMPSPLVAPEIRLEYTRLPPPTEIDRHRYGSASCLVSETNHSVVINQYRSCLYVYGVQA
jgi:hypothetical protein